MSIEDVCRDMAEKASEIDPLGKTLFFDFDEEQMLIDGTGTTNLVSVVTGEDVEPDCVVRMTLDTYVKLQRKEIKPFMAVASGKIKVKGDMSIASKLKKLT